MSRPRFRLPCRPLPMNAPGKIWVGDSLHGPPAIAPDGRVRTAYLLTQLDLATRYAVHSYFALSEDSAAHEYGFMQAVLKYGSPRVYYVDRSLAFTATSLRLICAKFDIRLLHTGASGVAQDATERWHRTWRKEAGDKLAGHPLPLAELNARHWAWLNKYHARKHATTGRKGGRRNLGAPQTGAAPTGIDPLAQLEREHDQRTRPVGAPTRFSPADDEE